MKVISKHERCGMMQAIDNVIYEHIKNNSPKWEPCGHPRSNMMEIGTKTIKNHMVKFAAQVFSRQVATSLEIQMKSLLSLQDHDYISLNEDIGNGLFTAEILLL
ncbi:uncharacterized protein LOC119193305 [Manduca sexta]|uniref:uncharacterized protein LOC119193305 n=1 Tax=Manduca sexta TaxID=7130 RepID=UPI00188FCDA8|nr:uncharacterized protein LOC119193305 [Manduca sexta]